MADGSPSLRIPGNSDAASDTVMEKRNTALETASPANVAAEVAPVPTAVLARPRNLKRPILFALLPVVLIAGGYFYVTGGQIMSTDNAYVQADIVGVSTDVSGIVQSIDVHDNEQVKQGQVLFRLDPAVYSIALAGAKAQLGVVRNQILNLEASYKQSLAEITQAEADIPFFQKSLQRQQDLNANSFASKATYDQAKHDLDAAQQKVDVAKAEAAATLAQLGGNCDSRFQ